MTEPVFLAYFNEIFKKYCPSTLWSKYSALKKMALSETRVDLKEFYQLHAFIKNKNLGYKSAKSESLTMEDVNNFLKYAPNRNYLSHKVSFLIKIYICFFKVKYFNFIINKNNF